MNEPKPRTKQRHYVNKKLRRKFYIYIGIFFLMLMLSLYEILQGYVHTLLGVAGWAIGVGIGILSGRVSKILWHKETEEVIVKRDTTGIIILIIYIAYALSRRWILGHWMQGVTLTGFSFCIVAGTRLGRIISMRKKVKAILREQGIF